MDLTIAWTEITIDGLLGVRIIDNVDLGTTGMVGEPRPLRSSATEPDPCCIDQIGRLTNCPPQAPPWPLRVTLLWC